MTICCDWNASQDLLDLLEKKIDEIEKRYEETSRLCEERLNQALDAETKMIALKTTMQRLNIMEFSVELFTCTSELKNFSLNYVNI